MSEKQAYCGTLEECLVKWGKRIKELEAEAKNAEGRQKAECRLKIEELNDLGEQMKTKLDEIREAEDHKWTSLKDSADKIREELERSIDFPISRFK